MTFELVNLNAGAASFGILRKAAERRFAERECGLAENDAGYRIEIRTDSSFTKDRYTVEADASRALLTAANDVTAHAAFGRWMLECSFDGRGGFTPFVGKIDFTPKDSLRGMYFATHFRNFYHRAPIEQVYSVIEDLAQRGCNSLLVWFDMHHFSSMDDPEAVVLTERLRAMLKYAAKIGMKGSLTMLSNEGFSTSPEHLRAEWTAQNGYFAAPGGHYHVEICPSKPGGIEEIIRERRAMLERFADLDIAFVCYWPYDQGGCTCKKCFPWGANGFMRLYPHYRALIKEMMPKTRVIMSTWYFDRFVKGEWDAFYPYIEKGMPEGVDYIMSFFFNGQLPDVIEKKGVPEGVKFIDFPEISMYTCTPWGGFGASQLAGFLNRTNEKSGKLYSGGFPYSEGIFEDVNKFITETYYSGLFENAEDAVRAYVRNEFCVEGEALDELTEALLLSETTIARNRTALGDGTFAYPMNDPSQAGKIYEILSKYNSLLPDGIRLGYKFRLWYLRAVIDRELALTGGAPTSEICVSAMAELCRIYYADAETNRWVRPPVGF
ncbi:MAG: hypothetical protein J6V01_00765 [Clostridia bacterium]|nr:hypothetical protein [Clostridia bacterium]